MTEPSGMADATTTGGARERRQLWARVVPPGLILAGGVLAFWGLSQFLLQKPRMEPETHLAPLVKVALVGTHGGGMPLQADGVVVPYRKIDLAAEVAGRVVERAEVCRAGNYVTQGALLARIDPQDYQFEKDRLEQERQQAVIMLNELAEEIQGSEQLVALANQQVDLRRRERARLQKLGRTVSLSEMEAAEGAELTAQNALLLLKNQIRVLKIRQGRLTAALGLVVSKLAKADLDLARTEIRSPVEGLIVADQIEQDAFVQRGAPLLTLEDTSKVEVKCKLEMDDLYWLWDRKPLSAEPAAVVSPADAYTIPETPVQVVYRLAGRNDREYVWDGRLSRYDGFGLDEKTRTVPCRVVVDNPRQRAATYRDGPPVLLRGMYVTIRMQVDPRTPLLKIPQQALQPSNLVWRVRAGRLDITPVRFVTLLEPAANEEGPVQEGPVQGSPVQGSPVQGSPVREGPLQDALICVDDSSQLVAGDQVVISPLTFVRSGMDVRVSVDQDE